MKRAFLLLLLVSAVQAFGQGTVVLNNRISGVVVTHVWYGCPQVQGNSSIDYPPGTTSYDGFVLTGAPGGPSASTTFATLLGAPGANAPESSLQPSSTAPTTFRTGGAAGNVVAVTDMFDNIPPDYPAGTFELVVWDNSSGFYPSWTQASLAWQSGLIAVGKSSTFVLRNIGGGTNLAPFMTNLTSFAWGFLECPPLIQQNPTNQAGVINGQAAFSIRALTYTGQPNYQWYFKNSTLPNATNSTLPLHNLQPANFGPYYVVVSQGIATPYDVSTSTIANLTFAVSPSLSSTRTGATSTLSFPTELGPNYVLEYRTNLTDARWAQLVTNAGTGGVLNITDSAVGISSRFYRVRLF